MRPKIKMNIKVSQVDAITILPTILPVVISLLRNYCHTCFLTTRLVGRLKFQEKATKHDRKVLEASAEASDLANNLESKSKAL